MSRSSRAPTNEGPGQGGDHQNSDLEDGEIAENEELEDRQEQSDVEEDMCDRSHWKKYDRRRRSNRLTHLRNPPLSNRRSRHDINYTGERLHQYEPRLTKDNRQEKRPYKGRRRVQTPDRRRSRSRSLPDSRRRSRSPSGARRRSRSPSSGRCRSRSPSNSRRRSRSPSNSRRRSRSPSNSRRRSRSPSSSRRRSGSRSLSSSRRFERTGSSHRRASNDSTGVVVESSASSKSVTQPNSSEVKVNEERIDVGSKSLQQDCESKKVDERTFEDSPAKNIQEVSFEDISEDDGGAEKEGDNDSIASVEIIERAEPEPNIQIITLDSTDTSDDDTDYEPISNDELKHNSDLASNGNNGSKDNLSSFSGVNANEPGASVNNLRRKSHEEDDIQILDSVTEDNSKRTECEAPADDTDSNDTRNVLLDEDLEILELRNKLLAEVLQHQEKNEGSSSRSVIQDSNAETTRITIRNDQTITIPSVQQVENADTDEEQSLREVLLSQLRLAKMQKKKKNRGKTKRRSTSPPVRRHSSSSKAIGGRVSPASSSQSSPRPASSCSSNSSRDRIFNRRPSSSNSSYTSSMISPRRRFFDEFSSTPGSPCSSNSDFHVHSRTVKLKDEDLFVSKNPKPKPPPKVRNLPANDLRKKLLRNASLRKSLNESDNFSPASPPMTRPPKRSPTEDFLFPEFGVIDTDLRQGISKDPESRLMELMSSDVTICRTVQFDVKTSKPASAITWTEPLSIQIPNSNPQQKSRHNSPRSYGSSPRSPKPPVRDSPLSPVPIIPRSPVVSPNYHNSMHTRKSAVNSSVGLQTTELDSAVRAPQPMYVNSTDHPNCPLPTTSFDRPQMSTGFGSVQGYSNSQRSEEPPSVVPHTFMSYNETSRMLPYAGFQSLSRSIINPFSSTSLLATASSAFSGNSQVGTERMSIPSATPHESGWYIMPPTMPAISLPPSLTNAFQEALSRSGMLTSGTSNLLQNDSQNSNLAMANERDPSSFQNYRSKNPPSVSHNPPGPAKKRGRKGKQKVKQSPPVSKIVSKPAPGKLQVTSRSETENSSPETPKRPRIEKTVEQREETAPIKGTVPAQIQTVAPQTTSTSDTDPDKISSSQAPLGNAIPVIISKNMSTIHTTSTVVVGGAEPAKEKEPSGPSKHSEIPRVEISRSEININSISSSTFPLIAPAAGPTETESIPKVVTGSLMKPISTTPLTAAAKKPTTAIPPTASATKTKPVSVPAIRRSGTATKSPANAVSENTTVMSSVPVTASTLSGSANHVTTVKAASITLSSATESENIAEVQAAAKPSEVMREVAKPPDITKGRGPAAESPETSGAAPAVDSLEKPGTGPAVDSPEKTGSGPAVDSPEKTGTEPAVESLEKSGKGPTVSLEKTGTGPAVEVLVKSGARPAAESPGKTGTEAAAESPDKSNEIESEAEISQKSKGVEVAGSPLEKSASDKIKVPEVDPQSHEKAKDVESVVNSSEKSVTPEPVVNVHESSKVTEETANSAAKSLNVKSKNTVAIVGKVVPLVGTATKVERGRATSTKHRSSSAQPVSRTVQPTSVKSPLALPTLANVKLMGQPRSLPPSPLSVRSMSRLIIPVRDGDSTSEEEEEETENGNAVPDQEFQQHLTVQLDSIWEQVEKRNAENNSLANATAKASASPISKQPLSSGGNGVVTSNGLKTSIRPIKSVQSSAPVASGTAVSSAASASRTSKLNGATLSENSAKVLIVSPKSGRGPKVPQAILQGKQNLINSIPSRSSSAPAINAQAQSTTKGKVGVGVGVGDKSQGRSLAPGNIPATSKSIIDDLTKKIIESRDQLALSAKEKELLQNRQELFNGYREIQKSLQQNIRLVNLDKNLDGQIIELQKKLDEAKKRQQAARSKAFSINQLIKEKSRNLMSTKVRCSSLSREVRRLGEKVIGERQYKVTDLFSRDILEVIKSLETLSAKQPQSVQLERGAIFQQLLGDLEIPPGLLAQYTGNPKNGSGCSSPATARARSTSGDTSIHTATSVLGQTDLLKNLMSSNEADKEGRAVVQGSSDTKEKEEWILMGCLTKHATDDNDERQILVQSQKLDVSVLDGDPEKSVVDISLPIRFGFEWEPGTVKLDPMAQLCMHIFKNHCTGVACPNQHLDEMNPSKVDC